MEKVIHFNNNQYKTIPEKTQYSCKGCVAQGDSELCDVLSKSNCANNEHIFEKVDMSVEKYRIVLEVWEEYLASDFQGNIFDFAKSKIDPDYQRYVEAKKVYEELKSKFESLMV